LITDKKEFYLPLPAHASRLDSQAENKSQNYRPSFCSKDKGKTHNQIYLFPVELSVSGEMGFYLIYQDKTW